MASRSATLRGLVLLALAATAVAAPAASARSAERPAPALERLVGDGTTVSRSGLLRVRPTTGRPLLTHGPDMLTAREAVPASGSDPFEPGSPERSPVCATDYFQQILYAHPAGSPDRSAAVAADLRANVRRMDAVLNAESLASGGPTADYKVLCDANGQIAIGSFQTQGASFADIVAGARAAGYRSSVADFVIYFDGNYGGSCGIASYNDDDRLTVANANNSGGGYGVVYRPCWPNETAMHESGHLMGAVQYGAPNSTGTGGHCYEEDDVLCYSPDGGDRNQGGPAFRCPGTPRFDCNFDDYFDSAPEPGEYLDGHWNLGSPLNRFISFDGSTTSPKGPGSSSRPSLGTGGKKRAAAGLAGEWRYFRFRAKRRAKLLRVRLFAASGADVALFVRRGKHPTREVWRCRDVVRKRHASCRLRAPARGIWYAGVLTRGGTPGLGYKISVRNKGRRH